MQKPTTYSIADVSALGILIRMASAEGIRVLSVEPRESREISFGFTVVLSDKIEVTNRTDFSPYSHGLDPMRTWWQEIVQHVT